MFDIILSILAWPLFAVMESVVGLLWPDDDPRIGRLQRRGGAMLLSGLLLGVLAGLIAWFAPTPLLAIPLVLALICLAVSVSCARQVERISKQALSQK